MPGGDKTGPRGMGPMTGRGAGYCAGQQVPGYMNPGHGRGYGMGWGRGRGFGRGRGRWFRGGTGAEFIPYEIPVPTQPSREQELEMLKQQAEYFKTAAEEISARIEELETPAKGE